MTKSRKVKVPEKRLSPEEYENALVAFEKSLPDIVNEREFRRRLRETTLARYRRGTKLLDQVKAAITEGGRSQTGQRELHLSVKKIDQAIVQMTHASLKFNKGATSEGIRSLIQITYDDAHARKRKK